MSDRLQRILGRSAIAVAGLGVAASLFLWFLLATGPGLQLVWNRVEPRLPASLAVEQVSGRLLSPLSLSGVRYRSEAAEAHVRTLDVRWRILPLLRRSLDVRTLTIEGVRVSLKEGEPEEGRREGPAELPPFRLPIDVRIGHARLAELTVFPPAADAVPTEVDSIALGDVSIRDEIRIGSLLAHAPMGRAHLHGRVRPRDRYPFEVDASWQLEWPERGPVVGDASARGDLDRIALATSLSEPIAASFAGGIRNPLTRLIVEGRLDVAETDIRRIAPNAPQAMARATIDVRGHVDSLNIVGSAHVEAPVTGPVDLEAALSWSAETALIERLDVVLGPAQARVTGVVDLLPGGPTADLALNWSNVRWPIRQAARLRSPAGTARIRGSMDAYRIDSEARLSAAPLPLAAVRFRGSGTPERLVADELRLETSEGRVRASGVISWAPEIGWQLELSGRDLDTRAVLADTIPWQGVLSLDGRTTGSLTDDRLLAEVIVDTLFGTVRGAPAGASTSARIETRLANGVPAWKAARLQLRRLEAEWGSNQASASGFVGDSLGVNWNLTVPDLSVVGEGFGGAAEGFGQLTGPRSHPVVQISAELRDVMAGSAHVTEGSLSGNVDTAPGGVVDVVATGRALMLGERPVDSLTLEVRGAPEEHEIRGVAWTPGEHVDVLATGGVIDLRWVGTMDRLDLALQELGTWGLAQPMAASISADSARIERGCWRSEPGEICASAAWEAGTRSAFNFEARDLPAERLAGSRLGGWHLDMGIDADGAVEVLADGALVASVATDLGSGRIGYPAASGQQELTYSDATLSIDVTGEGARSAFQAVLTGGEGREAILLDGALSLPEYTNVADTIRIQPVQGRVDARMRDFGALDALLPEFEAVAGDLEVDLDVSGTVERPEFVGQAHLRDGRADMPRLGLELRAIELVARGRGLEGITLEGGVTSGSGRVLIDGEVPVAPSAEVPARIRFRGDRVQAVALPDAEVWVSPNLVVTASPERIGVSGEVRVPRASIELSEIPETATGPSRDVVFVDDTTATARPMRNVGLNVRVVLGDSVGFRGYGFSAEPRGTMVVREGPGGATNATGEITLMNGRYRAYGQDLTMERGRIIFAGGPAENPGLDIRASRTADDGVVAGLEVTGTLRQPVTTLFSEPPMMGSEVLAYIVLGHPLGQASAAEGNRVANAAVALGIREGNVLASRIAQRFGLAEIRVAADGPLEEASLIAGKYLSPKLYVSYGVGLFEPISTFRLRYLLSGRWTLQAESGRSTGADLLYRIERGR